MFLTQGSHLRFGIVAQMRNLQDVRADGQKLLSDRCFWFLRRGPQPLTRGQLPRASLSHPFAQNIPKRECGIEVGTTSACAGCIWAVAVQCVWKPRVSKCGRRVVVGSQMFSRFLTLCSTCPDLALIHDILLSWWGGESAFGLLHLCESTEPSGAEMIKLQHHQA